MKGGPGAAVEPTVCNRKAWRLKQPFPRPHVVREAYGIGYALDLLMDGLKLLQSAHAFTWFRNFPKIGSLLVDEMQIKIFKSDAS